MSRINKINNDDSGDVGTLSGETVDECHLLRQELEALRSNRTTLRNSRCKEIELMECQYQYAKEKLQRKLPDHANVATYRQFLRYYQRDISQYQLNKGDGTTTTTSIYNRSVPSSNYIIQQETPLLSAMHRSFCVLPHQIELFEGEYEREIYPYFRKEIQALHLDSLEVSDDWMSRLSNQAEENDALYNSYRTELESNEMEVKRYRRLLLQQRAGKNPGKESEKGYDENDSILSESETECSSDSDDEISSRGEVGFGFLKEALFLFAPTPRQHAAIPSKIEAISGTFHDHLCKGGAAFQNAANNFLLPFTSKADCIDT
jgi:hypothetical protein